jgi:hypothetical protein
VASRYEITPKSIRDWRKASARIELAAGINPSKRTLNSGHTRQWAEEERIVVEKAMQLRDLGVGISASNLFELMIAEVPEFATKSDGQKWGWYTRLTKKYHLSMRRPNHITGTSRTIEEQQMRPFLMQVKDFMAIHNVIIFLIHRFPFKIS